MNKLNDVLFSMKVPNDDVYEYMNIQLSKLSNDFEINVDYDKYNETYIIDYMGRTSISHTRTTDTRKRIKEAMKIYYRKLKLLKIKVRYE